MQKRYIISLSVLTLILATNANAKPHAKKRSHTNHITSVAKHTPKKPSPVTINANKTSPTKIAQNNPSQATVPAIGSNVQAVEAILPNTPPNLYPDKLVTEPVALEKRKVPPPPANLMSGKNSILTNRENAGMQIAKSFSNNQVMPVKGAEGVVVFPFGETMPSIVCAPLIVCDITLQAGEIVNDINVGDAVRWKLSPATSGSGMNVTTHIIVKPTDAALQTNAIITTNRRTYVLKLVSRRTDYMARISFTYADDIDDQWRNYRAKMANQETPQNDNTNLNFNYEISGAKSLWKPIRIYSDTNKTYIEFPETIKTSEAPALLVLDDKNQEQLVNYRMVGTKYIVDKIFTSAELIGGTGNKQTKVIITKKDKIGL